MTKLSTVLIVLLTNFYGFASDGIKEEMPPPPPPLMKSYSQLLEHKAEDTLETSDTWYRSGALEKSYHVSDDEKVSIIDPDGWRHSKIKWTEEKISLESFLFLAGLCTIVIEKGNYKEKERPI